MLGNIEWEQNFADANVDESVAFLENAIKSAMEQTMRKKTIRIRKNGYDWITDAVLDAILDKMNKEGTAEERASAEQCSKVILDAFQAYRTTCKEELLSMRRGSKEWWTKSSILL